MLIFRCILPLLRHICTYYMFFIVAALLLLYTIWHEHRMCHFLVSAIYLWSLFSSITFREILSPNKCLQEPEFANFPSPHHMCLTTVFSMPSTKRWKTMNIKWNETLTYDTRIWPYKVAAIRWAIECDSTLITISTTQTSHQAYRIDRPAPENQ